MGLNYGQVVAVNNLLALKSFSTFLSNYRIHERPNFIERLAMDAADRWIELRARKEFIELKQGINGVALKLNDCQTSMFTVLYLATQKHLTFRNGKELFRLISETELDLERLKSPRQDATYTTPHSTEFGEDPK